jgi:2,4-dichlorophenol 6-monooxygenase
MSHVQDADRVTTTVLDRPTEREFTVRSRYLVAADRGNFLVADHVGSPLKEEIGVAGSIKLLCRMDLSNYVAHCPSVLYWVLQPGSKVGGIGIGVVRMVRPLNE